LLQGLGPTTAATMTKNRSKFRNIELTIDLLDEVCDLLDLLQDHERQIHLLKIMLDLYDYVPDPNQYDIVKVQVGYFER
jgi:hypothetical protein